MLEAVLDNVVSLTVTCAIVLQWTIESSPVLSLGRMRHNQRSVTSILIIFWVIQWRIAALLSCVHTFNNRLSRLRASDCVPASWQAYLEIIPAYFVCFMFWILWVLPNLTAFTAVIKRFVLGKETRKWHSGYWWQNKTFRKKQALVAKI